MNPFSENKNSRIRGSTTDNFGGGEENRTPVRKSVYTTFSERSLLLNFPNQPIDRQTGKSGSFINSWTAAKLILSHGHC